MSAGSVRSIGRDTGRRVEMGQVRAKHELPAKRCSRTLTLCPSQDLDEKARGAGGADFAAQNGMRSATLVMAFAGAQLGTDIFAGLNGEERMCGVLHHGTSVPRVESDFRH